jgi:hypothetical protein
MIKKVGTKHVVRKRMRKSVRRAPAQQTLDAFVSNLKQKYPADMVDRCLTQQIDGLPISRMGLVDCVEKAYKAAKPRASKDMKRDRSKG